MRKRARSRNLHVFIGLILGIGILALGILLYRTVMLKDYVCSSPKLIAIRDTSISNSTIQQNLNEIKLEHSTFAEKISATNKRIDDILVFGGIIVTLLLGITVGVYLKAESEVETHFRENFADYRDKIDVLVSEMEGKVAKAQSNLELSQKMREAFQTPLPPTPENIEE